MEGMVDLITKTTNNPRREEGYEYGCICLWPLAAGGGERGRDNNFGVQFNSSEYGRGLALLCPRDAQRDAIKRTMDGKVTSLAILTTSFAYRSCGRSFASGYPLCMHRSKV